MTASVDCVVIGAGPGGYVAAIRAAQLGMRTVVVERDPIPGGRCLRQACIPAKTVLRSADTLTAVRGAARYGVDVGTVAVNFGEIMARRAAVIRTLSGGIGSLFDRHRIETLLGAARVRSDRTVTVDDLTVQATTAVVLATGSVRRAPPGITFGGRVVGTEEAWAFTELPERLAVLGAGASGAEIASAYARLGSTVTLIDLADRVLPAEDADVSAAARRGFVEQGIQVRTSATVTGVHTDTERVRFLLDGEAHEADWFVVAAGRTPDTAALGLDAAGVALAPTGHVEVDAHLRTTVAGVYAIGDLVHGPALAHKASEEAIVAVETAAGHDPRAVDHAGIPRATFCSPLVGSVGLTEEAARAAGHDVAVGTVPYRAVGAGTVAGDRHGLVKIVGSRADGEVLGAHVVGSGATELIGQIVTLRHLEGGYPDLARIVQGHPTLSEALAEAARAADGWLIHG